MKYDENWFFQSSYKYNADLAEMSLGAAMAGMDNAVFDTLGKSGDKNIKALYKELGFKEDSFYSTGYDKEDDDSIGLALAYKKIQSPKNQAVTLLAVELRGSGYGSGGWQGDFNIGQGKENADGQDNINYHLGFYDAGLFAVNEVKNYISLNKIDTSNLKIWICGYSRSAAVGNIASILLGETVARSNIYTYAFATPSYQVNKETDSTLNNIFNIVNYSDVIPNFPPKKWGFSRQGTTVSLPDITDEELADFSSRLYDLSGVAYSGRNDYTIASARIANILADTFATREEYYCELQPSIINLLSSDHGSGFDYTYIDDILTCEGTNSEATSVESLMDKFTSSVSIDLDALLQILNQLEDTLVKGKEYWSKKDSYNDELLESLNDLLDFLVGVCKGQGSTEDLML